MEKDSLLFHLTNINNLPALGNLLIPMKPHHKYRRPALIPTPGRSAHLCSCPAAQQHTTGQNSATQVSSPAAVAAHTIAHTASIRSALWT